MDLPEIRLYVAQYLDSAQLAKAATVCKAWNTSFTPELYRKVKWSTGRLTLQSEKMQTAFQGKADFVRDMSLTYKRKPKGAASLDTFTHLENIDIFFDTYDEACWESLRRFLRQNQRIVTVKMTFGQEGDTPTQILRTLGAYCPKLKSIQVWSGSLDQKDIELFFSATCNRLERFSMGGTYLDTGFFPRKREATDWQLPKQLPKLEHLYLESSLPTLQQIALVGRCPRLKEFHWYLSEELLTDKRNAFPVSQFSKILATKCPLVEGLSLERCLLSDQDCASIVESCQTGISKVSFYQTKFGPLSLKPLLERHSNSLTLLNLVDCLAVTSAMTQQILVSCPNLETFHSTILNAQDVLGVGEGDGEDLEQIQPQNWACTSIRVLTIFITGFMSKPFHWRSLVFQQLARLESLEELDITPQDGIIQLIPRKSISNLRVNDYLDLRLESGLDKLSSLKRLRKLTLHNLNQMMQEKDVLWMVEAWPMLKAVYGDLHHSFHVMTALERILNNHNIETREKMTWFDDVFEPLRMVE
ncbi:hypothetical protein BGZ80_010036 [Entomortierella chlamydospora]|uniref:F-box domain-containing protein n=1 Tax=Entomortierella chlamydospora TaxID=101097 RepID=A0A9P6T0M9_9FUNG|nr:hypothetical protein BGZ79_000492 [Entomortierella chlamydospora]KAG0015118.1 hypothetical protein BGZ80_010036 [Entomortierella chlamydospora]